MATSSFSDEAFAFDFMGDVNVATIGDGAAPFGSAASTESSAPGSFSMADMSAFLPVSSDAGGSSADFFDSTAWGGPTGTEADSGFQFPQGDGPGDLDGGVDACWGTQTYSLPVAASAGGGMLPPSPIRSSTIAGVPLSDAVAVLPAATLQVNTTLTPTAVPQVNLSHQQLLQQPHHHPQQQQQPQPQTHPGQKRPREAIILYDSANASVEGVPQPGISSSPRTSSSGTNEALEGVRLSFNTSSGAASSASSSMSTSTSVVAAEHQQRCQALLHDVRILLTDLDEGERAPTPLAPALPADLDPAVFEARVQQQLRQAKVVSENSAQAAANLVLLSTEVLKLMGPDPSLGRLLGEEFADAPALFALRILLSKFPPSPG
jgi:hypothetical protein